MKIHEVIKDTLDDLFNYVSLDCGIKCSVLNWETFGDNSNCWVSLVCDVDEWTELTTNMFTSSITNKVSLGSGQPHFRDGNFGSPGKADMHIDIRELLRDYKLTKILT